MSRLTEIVIGGSVSVYNLEDKVVIHSYLDDVQLVELSYHEAYLLSKYIDLLNEATVS